MLALALLDRPNSTILPAFTQSTLAGPLGQLSDDNILYSSSRPALIPYSDPLVTLTSRLLFLAFHLMFPHAEKVTLTIPLAERLSFSRNKLLPHTLFLEIQAGQTLQVYNATVRITARLSGLRWLLSSKIVAGIFLSSLFCSFATLGMGLTWFMLEKHSTLAKKKFEGPTETDMKYVRALKKEQSFSSNFDGNQPYVSKQISLKCEDLLKSEVDHTSVCLADITPIGGDADDEDESPPYHKDSGIGSSSVRRRLTNHAN